MHVRRVEETGELHQQDELDQRMLQMAEHTKGARPSTKGKHQKGKARRGLDRGEEKGERLPPRKRPKGWTGS